MEKVALSNTQLDYLARTHCKLGPIYGGALPCDRLPKTRPDEGAYAYIVNTDPDGKPGRHWLALWTEAEDCELFDSFALPLQTYKDSDPLRYWIERHYNRCERNARPVQSITTQTCGYYALFYLMMKANGHSMEDFLSLFKEDDFLFNDNLVASWLEQLIEHDKKWSNVCTCFFRQHNE